MGAAGLEAALAHDRGEDLHGARALQRLLEVRAALRHGLHDGLAHLVSCCGEISLKLMRDRKCTLLRRERKRLTPDTRSTNLAVDTRLRRRTGQRSCRPTLLLSARALPERSP